MSPAATTAGDQISLGFLVPSDPRENPTRNFRRGHGVAAKLLSGWLIRSFRSGLETPVSMLAILNPEDDEARRCQGCHRAVTVALLEEYDWVEQVISS